MLSSMRAALSLVCVWELLDLVDMLNNCSFLSLGSHEQTCPRDGARGGGWLVVGSCCLECSQRCSLFLIHRGTVTRVGLEAEGGF